MLAAGVVEAFILHGTLTNRAWHAALPAALVSAGVVILYLGSAEATPCHRQTLPSSRHYTGPAGDLGAVMLAHLVRLRW